MAGHYTEMEGAYLACLCLICRCGDATHCHTYGGCMDADTHARPHSTRANVLRAVIFAWRPAWGLALAGRRLAMARQRCGPWSRPARINCVWHAARRDISVPPGGSARQQRLQMAWRGGRRAKRPCRLLSGWGWCGAGPPNQRRSVVFCLRSPSAPVGPRGRINHLGNYRTKRKKHLFMQLVHSILRSEYRALVLTH